MIIKWSSLIAGALLTLQPAVSRTADLIVGANIGNVPWEFQNADGDFVGFELDLVRKAAARMGKTVEIINIPFNGLFSAVQSGRINIALSSITRPSKRRMSANP